MKYLVVFLSLVICSVTWSGCESDPKPKIEPSDLVVEKTISIDGSGLVTFTATADDAEKFVFSFGDGTTLQNSDDGKTSHNYINSGTYNVKVFAYSVDDLSIDKTISITIEVDEPTISDEGYTTPESYNNMTLVWQDEFSGDALNLDDWTYEIGNGSGGWGNNELEYYTNANTIMQNGYLTIKAKKESIGGFNYTSSRIVTKNKQEFKYARIDIRAKLPKGQGIWPALWMLGSNISTVGWPKCGEVDIMEMIGGGTDRDNKVYGTAHWDNNNAYASYGGNKILSAGTFADKFHVFSIVWDEEKIVWYLDDVQYHIIDITPLELSEFRSDYFIIFNVAVGGNWPGSPDASLIFPQRMIVDYIRVFQ